MSTPNEERLLAENERLRKLVTMLMGLSMALAALVVWFGSKLQGRL